MNRSEDSNSASNTHHDTTQTNASRTTILIQAENENTAAVYAPHSTKEFEASYRRGWTGQGDWYLSTGGDLLTYQFSTAVAETYALWVRDWNDNLNNPGARTLTVLIDQQNIGTFPENPNRDYIFHWHRLTDVRLSRGRHIMSVIKTQSTTAAAILDAFQFIRAQEGNTIP